MTRRLFFALWPERAQRSALEGLRGQCGEQDVRWQDPAKLHMTLVFIGACPSDRVADLVAAARSVAVRPASLTLDGWAIWERPRILCAEPATPPRELLALQGDLQAALASAGFPPEARAWRPHVTLGRRAAGRGKGAFEQPVDWAWRGFALVESEPVGGGTRYVVIEQFPTS